MYPPQHPSINSINANHSPQEVIPEHEVEKDSCESCLADQKKNETCPTPTAFLTNL